MDTEIKGYCDTKFNKVRNAFVKNFKDYDELGASLCIVENNKVVVNLFGGSTSPEREHDWNAETVVNIWSTTKGVSATCIAILVSRGVISYDTKISDIWPEFACQGKNDITLSMLISHQAGLCGFAESKDISFLYNSLQVEEELAKSIPYWPPGEKAGYHALTIGFLVDAIIKRTDGRSIKEFIQQELCNKLGLKISIGLPTEWEDCSSDVYSDSPISSAELPIEINEYQKSSLMNPLLQPSVANTEGWKGATIASANGFANASSLAKLYGMLATNGNFAGQQVINADAIIKATSCQYSGQDAVLSMPVRWANGFLLNCHNIYGPNVSAFGHSGWGGSFAFADPKLGLGCAYTMNKMGNDLVGDSRNVNIVEAIYRCT